MKSQTEIVAKFKEVEKEDYLGFNRNDLLDCMTYESAKPYLKDGVTEAEWNDVRCATDEELKKKIVDYVPFAWEKANDCRGISAWRSLEHFKIWFWLLGEDELSTIFDGDYEHYGKEKLLKAIEWAGLNAEDFDDGVRVNSESEL